MNILAEIAWVRRWDVSLTEEPPGLTGLPPVQVRGPSFREAVTKPGLSIIAEIKRRAPSAGDLCLHARAGRRARVYELGGASALSVLTEPRYFAGSYVDLWEAASATELPVLCKDFVVNRRQIEWAAKAGARCVLLIVAILTDEGLRDLLLYAQQRGLDTLVEIFDRRELGRALEAGAGMIGINSRDLRDFSVSLERVLELRRCVPAGIPVVSESGVRGPEDLRLLRDAGFDAVLVGTSLMRSRKPGKLLRKWREALGEGAG